MSDSSDPSRAGEPPRNLSQQRKRAKELLEAARSGDAAARDTLRKAGAKNVAKLKLADAQRAIAYDAGFDSWPKLVAQLEQAELIAAFQAVHRGDAESLRRILKSSPSARRHVNDPIGPFGGRPINMAAEHRDVLDVLIDYGADINARSAWDKGPFGVLDACDEETARHLLTRGAALTAHAAARFGWIDELRAIVDAKPNVVHELGGDGQRPLHFAKTIEVADLLLGRGAKIDARDVDHLSTAAQYALVDRAEIATHLLARGATADIFMAARLGDVALAKRLIDAHPASLAARTWHGDDPLVPKMSIYTWTLGFLVSPFEVALKYGHADVFDLLTRKSPPIVRFLDGAMRVDEDAARAAMHDDSTLVQSMSGDLQSLIAMAAFHGRPDAARLMLKLGFDPMARGEEGGTVLHAACWTGQVALVDDLIASGVDLNDRDHTYGSTPLGWAAFGSTQRSEPTGDYIASVEHLARAGADVRARGNKSGKTLVEMARGNEPVQDALRRAGAPG